VIDEEELRDKHIEFLHREVERLQRCEQEMHRLAEERDLYKDNVAKLTEDWMRLQREVMPVDPGSANAYILKLEERTKELEAEAIDLKNTVIQRDAEIKKVEIECYRLLQANSKLKQDLEYAEMLLKQFEEAVANRSAGSLEAEMTKSLNRWSVDSDLNAPDFIISKHMVEHLYGLKRFLESLRKHMES
jgi:chromosome segregation ATPase